MNIPWQILLERATDICLRGGLAVGLYIAFHFVGMLLSQLFERVADKTEPERRYVIGLLASTIRFAVYTVGAVTALATLGINVSALIAGLGLTGFAVGFALKDMLSNLISGILILLYQPFRVGDAIQVTGSEGRVQMIDLRYTVLVTGEGRKVLVPNSSIFSNIVVVDKARRPSP